MVRKPLDYPMQKLKKGLWSPDEDLKLRNYVLKYGHGCWSSVPANAGLQRNGKSCRLRWINYLRPGLKRGAFSLQEEETILALHQILGNKWSQMAQHLPGRTDNEIKNHWHSYLKKRMQTKVPTQIPVKKETLNDDPNQILEHSPPSLEPVSQNPSFESLKNRELSINDTNDPSILEINQSRGPECNFPKVLFSEWLSIDHFPVHDMGSLSPDSSADFMHPLEANISSSEDSWNLLDRKTNGILVEDHGFQCFSSNYFSENCPVVDYFPGRFGLNCDDMYM